MSKINFTKNGNEYVAEMEVTSDFNLHVEFKEDENVNAAFSLVVESKTSGTKYAHVTCLKGVVVDEDFDGVIYPKNIRLTASREVDDAYLTLK